MSNFALPIIALCVVAASALALIGKLIVDKLIKVSKDTMEQRFNSKETQEKIDNQIINAPNIHNRPPRFEYLYGFTNSNPEHHLSDKSVLGDIANLVLGTDAGIIIGASMHPYQAIHPKNNIWESCLSAISSTNCVDIPELIRTSNHFIMNPPQKLPYLDCEDNRLHPDVNPQYGKYVPFLIPYIAYTNSQLMYGECEILEDMGKYGHASKYLTKISTACRPLFRENTVLIVHKDMVDQALADESIGFNMPIGFGIYEPGAESDVVNKFEECLKLFNKSENAN